MIVVSELVIKDMSEQHVDDVVAIEQQENSIPQSASRFIKEIHDPTYIILVGEQLGNVVGFINAQIIGDELHIHNLIIEPSSRRKGFAEKLVKKLIQDSKKLNVTKATLEVRVNNSAAISLYEKFDFIKEGIREKYYIDNGEDALIMWNYYKDGDV